MFQETGDRTNFQGRYVIRHPWTGNSRCEGADRYRNVTLPRRQDEEARTLANLTGWDINEIRTRLSVVPVQEEAQPWWKTLWTEG